MRILVLSKEVWRDDQNGGSVLSNIFSGFEAEFAQIYCSSGEPKNALCKKYYQMTDKMMICNIFKGTPVGIKKEYCDFPEELKKAQEDFKIVKKINLECIRVAREIAWKLARWDINGIIQFCKGFAPDIIFAPCYGNHYMMRLTRMVKEELQVPVISYISDDFYTNKQFRVSPIFWINHFAMRRQVRNIFKMYDLVYTMTEEQKRQCETDFKANMKILCKSGEFSKENEKQTVGTPIRFIYAGGMYLNRWKTLKALADAMKKINENHLEMTMDIYSNAYDDEKIKRKLHDGRTVKMHPTVPMDELREIYRQFDVALHVEGFDLKNRWTVRNSFSSKIIDCLDSGCAVMAICDKKQAGWSYIKRENAGICISKPKDIYKELRKLIDCKENILKYQKNAFQLGREKHLKTEINQKLLNDFVAVLKKEDTYENY